MQQERTGRHWMMERMMPGAGLAVVMIAAMSSYAYAQSAPPPSDNPFPEQQQQTPAKPDTRPATPPTTAPKAGSDNPFPGENTDAPIIPVEPGNASGAAGGDRPDGGGGSAAPSAERGADPDGDPVRSPDQPGLSGDGFSSSRAGLPSNLPVEDDTDAKAGKSTKNKTREERIKDDLNVGQFYAEKKDWRGALGRYTDAVHLDKENEDAVLGLAEAERHLRMNKEALEHYQLFLSYDPDGPHSKLARKGLDEVQLALTQSGQAAR